jgi:pre-mRNA cleavage complex 2 protein Pcf11
MDSIIKNHGDPYKPLFMPNLATTFACVFARSNEKDRSSLFKLRSTWTPIFPSERLYALDLKVQTIDPAWPLAAKPPGHGAPNAGGAGPNIHINPAVFARQSSVGETDRESEEIKRMERELMDLKKKKLQLELEATRKEVAQVIKFILKSWSIRTGILAVSLGIWESGP